MKAKTKIQIDSELIAEEMLKRLQMQFLNGTSEGRLEMVESISTAFSLGVLSIKAMSVLWILVGDPDKTVAIRATEVLFVIAISAESPQRQPAASMMSEFASFLRVAGEYEWAVTVEEAARLLAGPRAIYV